jgi:solute carrier family 45, member 1/2/4
LIWALNVAIQPVQMGIRAMIVDCCPPHQQVQASAYASSITGVGSILGYASGFVNLPSFFPWLGDTQFKCLCVVASVALGSTVALSCSVIKEKSVLFEDEVIGQGIGPLTVFRQVLRSVKLMSKRMKRICTVQFFAWIGWFPFLFYITTYVGGLCKFTIPHFKESANVEQIKEIF